MNKLKELQSLMTSLEVDLEKFYGNDNKAASIRARKTLQYIKEKSQEIRMHISETRNQPKT
tara:strand:- start:292 stop:474 length:183 start_codon:yes stop_codon:yes gene_type:complete